MMRIPAILLSAATLCSVAPGQGGEEYRLKAAFLYNFTRFVEWPAESLKGPNDPIAICVLGKVPFGTVLAGAVDGKASQSHPLVVIPVVELTQAASCQVLFVPSSERKKYRAVLDAVAGRGALTVGETEGFLDQGGVIVLKLEDRKIRLQVNLTAAEKQRLKISSKLLSLATIIKETR